MTALPPADAATIAAESAVTDGAAVAPTPDETGEFVRIGRRRILLRRFLRNPSAITGSIIFLLLIAFSIFGGLLTPYSYDQPDFLALTRPRAASTRWTRHRAATTCWPRWCTPCSAPSSLPSRSR
ncbi:hypothetical protein [Acidipropionibacterium acidipropionici]|uniref:hypothetical protein n=1 Tax=Acidipropionibacterium acidipropionici TaxID=1748 RepID=UPI0009E9CB60